jgi:hypothetical protein
MLAQDPFLSIHKALTGEIIAWFCDSKRRNNVYLLAESLPASYPIEMHRNNVLASICCSSHRLGAQPHFYEDAISTQLAARFPPYRRVLAGLLVDNPGILELPTRTRFKKLIYEPWKTLQESHPQYIVTPPVIVLRWESEHKHGELFRSICEFSSSQHSPLLWIISIDGKVKFPIPNLLDPLRPFEYTRLPISYDGGLSDAALILHHRFSLLRQKYEEMFDRDEKWPSKRQMSHLASFILGTFESVDAIIDFVDCGDDGGPRVHLEAFLTYMVDSPSPSNEQPYCALDHFYTQMFSTIPLDLLSIANRVLSLMYYGVYFPLTPLKLACLLSIRKLIVLSALAYLSRWAVIRTEDRYGGSTLFRGFLEDPKRSGRFHIPNSDLVGPQASLHILSHSPNLIEILKPQAQWIQLDPKAYKEVDDLRNTVAYLFGDLDMASNLRYLECIVTRRIDFRFLSHTCDKMQPVNFVYFLWKLYEVSTLV